MWCAAITGISRLRPVWTPLLGLVQQVVDVFCKGGASRLITVICDSYVNAYQLHGDLTPWTPLIEHVTQYILHQAEADPSFVYCCQSITVFILSFSYLVLVLLIYKMCSASTLYPLAISSCSSSYASCIHLALFLSQRSCFFSICLFGNGDCSGYWKDFGCITIDRDYSSMCTNIHFNSFIVKRSDGAFFKSFDLRNKSYSSDSLVYSLFSSLSTVSYFF